MNINPPSDPVIKKRVSITGNTSQIKWTILGGLSVVGLVGVIYYFFPNTFHNFDDFTQFHSEHKDESSKMTQSLAFTDKGTTSTSSEIEARVSVTETPKNLGSESLTKNNDINIPAEASQPVDTKATPLLAPISSPVATATAESIVTQSTKPATTTESTEDIQSTTILESSTKPLTPVQRLLAKAKQQLNKTRFTSPKGDNAYETYQELSQIDPQSAQQILDSIVAWYFKQGKKYIDRGRLTQPRRANAYKMYQKLQEIAPEHKSTQALFNEIVYTLFQHAEQYLQEDNLTTPRNKNAYAVYQKILSVDPQSKKVKGILESIVQRLLIRANQQMEKQSYTTPKNDNAVDTYQQILKISPNHVEALNGLNEIADQYYKLAARKKRQARYKDSMKWIKKGLQVQPDHPELNQLKQEVAKQLY